jgi:hypothetical protein
MPYESVFPGSNINRVNSLQEITSLTGFGQIRKKKEREGRGGHDDDPKRKVKDYLKALTGATESSNQKLKQNGIPFQFCVYKKGAEIYIDFVNLDENGKIKECQTRKITDDDFSQWIDDISNVEGLFFDKTG